MNYFDSTYVVRCYLDEPGAPEVRELGLRARVACLQLGQAEVTAAFHRKRREGALNDAQFVAVVGQFEADIAENVVNWLPLREAYFTMLRKAFAALPATTFLRAADALHLICARDAGFAEVHTNDRHMLGAAPHFGLKGVNVIAPISL